MRAFPAAVGRIRGFAFLAGWALIMVKGGGTARSQETMVDYPFAAPMVVEGKSGVVIERLRFRHRMPAGQAAVQIRNSENVILRSCAFTGLGAAVLIEASRAVRVEDCAFVDLWEHGATGPQPQIAVEARFSRQLTVTGNLFEFISAGLYAYQSESVVFSGNTVMNTLGPFPRGQAVQFNGVRGAGNLIQGNFVRNESKISAPQDCVNLFQSFGTKESPILVADNYVAGDPEDGSEGKSSSGSGIMAGDGGGGYQVIQNNRLDSPGQAGIGVAGGGNILVQNNVVRGTQSDVSNVGIVVWSQYRQAAGPVSVVSNLVGWRNQLGRPNGLWVGRAKYGPAYEFSEVRTQDNQMRFPEDLDAAPVFVPTAWTLAEGTKYSKRLRQAAGNLEALFDPTQD